MSKFRANEFKIQSEPGKGDIRVVKLEQGAGKPIVEQFEFGKVGRTGPADYKQVKAKFGALAATDPERAARAQKDRRFTLNQLSRGPLSVEEEEKRVVEELVRNQVAALADQAKAAAIKEGYQIGLKEGHEEAFKKFQREGTEKLQALESLIAEFEAAKGEIFRANERFLMEVIYRIAKMVLLKELSVDKDYLLRLTGDLLERVGIRENITVRIHPQDKESIDMLKEGLDKYLGGLKNLNIETSTQVNLGGCTVETEWNAIDASVETQLKGVYEALIGQKNPDGQKT